MKYIVLSFLFLIQCAQDSKRISILDNKPVDNLTVDESSAVDKSLIGLEKADISELQADPSANSGRSSAEAIHIGLFNKGKKLEDVKSLITEETLNAQTALGQTALHILLDKKIIFNNGDETNPQMKYVNLDEKRAEELLPIFLEKKPNVNLADYKGNTVAHILVRKNDTEMFKKIAELDLDTDILNKEGDSLLHIAMKNNNTEMLEEILKLNPDTQIKDRRGKTFNEYLITKTVAPIDEEKVPHLIETYSVADAKVIHALGKLNPDFLNVQNLKGQSLVHIALEELAQSKDSNKEKLEALLAYDIDVNGIDKHGKTPLHTYMSADLKPGKEDFSVIKLLSENRVDLNLQDNQQGFTPLHLALDKKYPNEFIHEMIKSGADTGILTTKDKTAFDIAKDKGFSKDILDALKN